MHNPDDPCDRRGLLFACIQMKPPMARCGMAVQMMMRWPDAAWAVQMMPRWPDAAWAFR